MSKKEVSYDDYMPLTRQERIKVFNEISAENRAILVKTQVERWLMVNISKLNKQQTDLLNETIEFITPDKYEEDRDYEKVERETAELSNRVSELFTQDEMMQFMSPVADYIPPIDKTK